MNCFLLLLNQRRLFKMLNSRSGYSLIMVLLILFIVIIFIALSISVFMASSNYYGRISEKRAEILTLQSCIHYLNDVILSNEEKANFRINNSVWTLGGRNLQCSVYYNSLDGTSDNNFMLLEAVIKNKITGIDSRILGIKPVPLLEYAHFIVNPNTNYTYDTYSEHVSGGIRTNNQYSD